MLVGSVPLETAEAVFEKIGMSLGPYLRTLPDGEVGDRQYWVVRMQFQIFNGHPDLLTVKRPAPDNGVERLIPRDAKDGWFFKVRDGVDSVRFGNPGWRLGYARDAIQSYAVFRAMKERGIIPASVRFQVSLPLANSAVSPRVFSVEDLPRVRPGFTEALQAEVAKIVEWIPNEDLAIQWDASWELSDACGAVPGLDPRDALERNVKQVRTLAPGIPEKVALGYHLCFGTFGGWPRIAPDDLGQAVKLANAFVAASGRRVDWLHIPALDTVDEAFYRPLSRLEPGGARVYLGLIHNMETYKARLAVARKFLPDFGVAAYCGFGRLPPTELEKILQDHLDAVRAL
jgi:hypothetical protein